MGFAEGVTGALASLNLPPWLVIAVVALLPFVEMRGAVPIAFFVYHWDLGTALLFTGVISLIPGVVIAFYMDRLEPYLRKAALFDRVLTRVFAWTRKKEAQPDAQEKRDRNATILLAVLVALPGPGTGAWTGGLVSYVFEVPKKKAAAALILGVIGEAVAMALIVVFLGFFF